jgi:hypothetical protein
MGQLVAASCPHVALLQPHTFNLIDFQAVLVLLQQNQKYKIVLVLAYLSCLVIGVRPNGKSGHVPGNGMDHF